MKRELNKKAQHEIVGFVIIVVIVAVIGVIFLSLTISRDEIKQTSVDISNLLEASMYYTTDCAISFIPSYKNVQELIRQCYESPIKNCLNDKKVCDSLEENLNKIISKSLDIDEQGVNKAYKLDIYYQDLNSNLTEEIFKNEVNVFEDCNPKLLGSHSIPSGFSGIINVELEVCKG